MSENTEADLTVTTNTPDMVTISAEEYASLKDDQDFLLALQGAGVDNWDGYDYAMELRREWAEEGNDEF